MVKEAVREKGSESQLGFEQPVTIDASPSTAAFRDKLTYLFSHLDGDFLTKRGLRFQEPLVNWDGVNRLGERKFVSIYLTSVHNHVVSGASIIFPDAFPDSNNLNALHTNDRIGLTTHLNSRRSNEVFVIWPHDFLNFFQTACIAVEECLTSYKIYRATLIAQSELLEKAKSLERHPDRRSDYSEELYAGFLKRLAELRYSAY